MSKPKRQKQRPTTTPKNLSVQAIFNAPITPRPGIVREAEHLFTDPTGEKFSD